MQPRRPKDLSPYAETCVQALASLGLGGKISLGGGLGLLHYLDYRSTQDVDAWWLPTTTAEERRQVIAALETALSTFGSVRQRAWGEVVSVELTIAGRAVFSFQIAHRSAQLEPCVPAPWADTWLDSLSDLVASKMVALVERGAPRDFRATYAVCQAGLITPAGCWQLWRERQLQAGSDTRAGRARLALETHLSRITQHRPLDQIADPAQRAEATALRDWFQGAFLGALVD